jgi:spoIIIJ-associated protein
MSRETPGSETRLNRAQVWLESVLKKMGIPATVKANGEHLEIDSSHLSEQQKATLLGSLGGDGSILLDSLQYLTNTVVNSTQSEAEQQYYTIELDGYRKERYEALEKMALQAVEFVRQSHQEYQFGSLSSAERRYIHTYLKNPGYEDIETLSRGKEPDRHLVVRPLLLDQDAEGEA